jgi:hypothetical protein
VGYFSLIWRIFDKLVRQQEQVISFRLPLCDDCRMKRLEVARFDWDDYSVLAYCHPDFCDALKNQTGGGAVGDGPPAPDFQEPQRG